MRRGLYTAALAIAGAALLGADGADRKAAATRPASAPAPAGVPASELDRLIDQLGSDEYHLRRDARDRLGRLVDLPGVADVLRSRLSSARDPAVRTALAALLEAFAQPIAVVWYRGGMKELPQAAPAPWLYVQSDGWFLYDAASCLFTGQAALGGDWRCGRMPAHAGLDLKRTIADSRVLRESSEGLSAGTGPGGPIHVSFYLRAGRKRTTLRTSWEASRLRPGKPPAAAAADLKLALALRQAVLACPAEAYDGPMALHTIYNPAALRGRRRKQIQKLPEWPVAGVNLLDPAARLGGIRVEGKLLRQVRAALAKTNLYRYHKYAACQVLLAPHVEAALRLGGEGVP